MGRELIRLVDVHKSFGPAHVLDGIDLQIEKGERIGIIGHNGSGKTTLLNTISNRDQDIGDIEYQPGLRIAYLNQIRDIDEDATIEQELERRGHQFKEIEDEIATIESSMATEEFYAGDWEPTMARYQELQSMLAKSGGGDVAGHAQNILDHLGLSQRSPQMALAELSGGERAKVALARQLVGLAQIDALFLDEPTNHLDMQTIEWLEGFLARFHGSILIVSHDRYFLDQICNSMLEMRAGRIRSYSGNYSAYMQQKQLFLQTLDDRISKAEKEVKRLLGALQSMKRANKYDKSISQKRFMLGRTQRELKWLKSIKPRQRKGINFKLESANKSSFDVFTMEQANLSFDEAQPPILKDAEIDIARGQRIGLIGPNGAGKTTLLKVIMGEQSLDSGHLELSAGVQVGYFHQDHRTLDFDLTPVQQVQLLKPRMEYADIRALLGRFQFTKEMVGNRLGNLSGGERARIAILKLLIEENNLLLMDEPTNHLDTEAKEALEEALQDYDGSLLVVSHDRWFLDQVCNRIWLMDGDGKIQIHQGNYSSFINS